MKDADCTVFLQWALPRLRFRWPGFRKVRRQVCRRIRRRIGELGLRGFGAYRLYLEAHPEEETVLDGFCRVTISCFYRDRQVFDRLGQEVLPQLAQRARERREPIVRAWSAGCASGEEPYSLAIVWRLAVALRFSDVELRIVATDADTHLLERARTAAYEEGSLKELPAGWREQALRRAGGLFQPLCEDRNAVELLHQDLRREMPTGPFDLVLCRNLAFTYFDEPLQREVSRQLVARLCPGGWLVIGSHETLPAIRLGLDVAGRCFYRSPMSSSDS